MTRKIWKFPVPNDGKSEVHIPVGSKVIHVGLQDGKVCVWAECPSHTAPNMRVVFFCTGDDAPPPDYQHVGTVIGVSGWAVLHAYAERNA